MSQSGLDWKNPTGICSFVLLKQFCDNERDILEPYKSIESGITKPKSIAAHATNQSPPPNMQPGYPFHITIPPAVAGIRRT